MSDVRRSDVIRLRAQDMEFPVYGMVRPANILYSNMCVRGTGTEADVGADKLFATPFMLVRKARIDRLAIYIAGAGGAGAKARMGIYSNTMGKLYPDYPDKLLLDAGEVDATTTGYKYLVIDLVLEPSIYWIACILNDSTIDLQYLAEPMQLMASSPDYMLGWTVAQAYGPLPSAFPAGGSMRAALNMCYRVAEWL